MLFKNRKEKDNAIIYNNLPILMLDGHVIERVVIDQNLSWHEHTAYLIKKVLV